MQLEFVVIAENHCTNNFDCGNESLNEYLIKHALVNQARRLGVTIVAHEKGDEQKQIIGYYTLSPAQFDSTTLPKKFARSLPKYPIAALRLCRLAVDKKHQNKNCGKELLVHALGKCFQQSSEIGGYCVIVDAIDDRAKAFYERFGFTQFLNQSHSLFISMKLIEAYINGEGE